MQLSNTTVCKIDPHHDAATTMLYHKTQNGDSTGPKNKFKSDFGSFPKKPCKVPASILLITFYKRLYSVFAFADSPTHWFFCFLLRKATPTYSHQYVNFVFTENATLEPGTPCHIVKLQHFSLSAGICTAANPGAPFIFPCRILAAQRRAEINKTINMAHSPKRLDCTNKV